MNVSEEFFKGHEENAEEFHQRLSVLETMCRKIVSSLGLDRIEVDDLFQKTLLTLWRETHLQSREGTPWEAYVWGMARNLAVKNLNSRGFLSKGWTLTDLSSDPDSREGPMEVGLEEVVGDGSRNSDEAFFLLDQQIRYDEWQVAYAERFDQIVCEEIAKISLEPLFGRFIETIRNDNLHERVAWRNLVHDEIDRIRLDPVWKHSLQAIKENWLDEETAWGNLVRVGATSLKSFPTFNRYYNKLKEAVARRWQSEQIAIPEDLQLGHENPYFGKWKRAGAVKAKAEEDTSCIDAELGKGP